MKQIGLAILYLSKKDILAATTAENIVLTVKSMKYDAKQLLEV